MNHIDGFRLGYVFLKTDGMLSDLERISLVIEAFDMHVQEESRREVLTDTYNAVIRTDGKYGLIGVYGGLEYRATVETEEGTATLKFLVHEPASARWN